ncbi:MAG: hypothetical protein EAY68_08020 [Bacteroidetes bacterium]|nr:MAG: hypothetical protein EAY68_08020 [Bacteroidota bacterium]
MNVKNSNNDEKNSYMKKCSLLLMITFMSLYQSCKNESSKCDYYSNGNIKESYKLVDGKKNGLAIYYWENGKIRSLDNYQKDQLHGEVLKFYYNGVLEQKMFFSNGVPNGVFYTFYHNGSIKSYRKFVNGKKEGYSEDYWEKDGDIKAVYFSINDTLVYIRRFDSLGYVIETRGDVPSVPNSKVN